MERHGFFGPSEILRLLNVQFKQEYIYYESIRLIW